MSRFYKEETIIKRFQNGLPYQSSCVNYHGVSKEGKDYIELLSDYILSFDAFDLKEYKCRDSFFLHKKTGYKPDTKSEKGLCRYWYYKGFDEEPLKNKLGEPIEYELNLYGKRVNIDLVSYKNGVIHLIEVKGKVEKDSDFYLSTETLLRCALEIKTYSKTIKSQLSVLIQQLFAAKKIDRTDVRVELDVLVPDNEFFRNQIDNKCYPSLNKLLKKWNINITFYQTFKREYQ